MDNKRFLKTLYLAIGGLIVLLSFIFAKLIKYFEIFKNELVLFFTSIVFAVSLFIIYEAIRNAFQKKANLENNTSITTSKVSSYDALTGLYNIKELENIATTRIAEAPDKNGAMFFMDLENLKIINTKYGNDTGNQFLLTFGTALKYLEQHGGEVSRVFGDKFVVYIHGYNNDEEILTVFKEFSDYCSTLSVVTSDDISHKLRFSAGVAFYPKDGADFGELYKFSDFALYDSKHNEKGRLANFDLTTYNKNSFLLENAIEICNLLDNRLLRFMYQPIVDLKTGEIFAYEALMRSSLECFKSPYEIIKVASAQSKLNQLEAAVVFLVYEDLEKNAHIIGDKKIFLNSLPNQVLNLEDAELLIEKYQKYFKQVVVEITEQENLNKSNMEKKLSFLKRMGIDLAVDDFGTGFSNELRILDLKPNIVKIDMGLIQDIHKDKDKQVIVKNIIEFCHSKDIELVAEGVEVREDLEYIIAAKVDYVQGYYIAKPAFGYIEISEEKKNEICEINRALCA